MPWELTGNAGTNPANNFLGTTDNSALVIKINGGEALRIDTNHNVGIGTTAPGARLTIEVSGEGTLALRLMSGPNAFLDITPTNVGGRFQTVLNTVNNRDVVILPGTGNLGVGTPSPAVRTQVEGSSDPEATVAIRRADNNKFMRLGVGSVGVALDFDPTSVFVIQRNTAGIGGHLAGPELLRVTADGHVGIGTTQPATPLHVGGNLTLDSGDGPVLFTGTGTAEHNRYLNLINSPEPNFRSASGLKAGGVLISDDYAFANPGKNDLVVKGSATVHGEVIVGDQQGVLSGQNGGSLLLRHPNGSPHIQLIANETSPDNTGGGLVNVAAGNGTTTIQLNGNNGTVQAGDVLLAQGDCAEDFDLCPGEMADCGSVMVIDQAGTLSESQTAYDPRVAGVISGAGGRKPAITLDKQAPGRARRLPLALSGKVYCKVDAKFDPIQVGDLLVTSPTRAHAMKASDRARAFGAVIGKALEGLERGQGLIPILVCLQ